MRTFFVEGRYLGEVRVPERHLEKLPERIALFMSVQFIGSYNEVKKQLEKAGKRVFVFKTRHTVYPGQLYGCNNQRIEGDFEAFLYIGDGEFHPKALALANKKPIYVYNPVGNAFFLFPNSYFEKERKRTLAALKAFYSSSSIGVLVTTKPGQNKINLGYKLRELFPEKEFYFLAFNTIDFSRLGDFPFVEVFVNTACERIAFEDRKKFPRPVLNAEDVPELGLNTEVKA